MSETMASIDDFGRVGENDWPLRVPAKFKLFGSVVERGFWHAENPGKAPVFCGEKAARKALARLYRKHGRQVTVDQCRDDMAESYRRTLRNRGEFLMAVAHDMAAGRIRSLGNGSYAVPGGAIRIN